MSSIFGNKLKMMIFGESHGHSIGAVIEGLPPGIELDMEFIKSEMRRRAPGRNEISTARKEADEFIIQSGYFENKTTGMPLSIVIKNSDTHSKDYSILKDTMRPSHGDYPGNVKYMGYNDYRGGGSFSGRLTAPLVFAGAVAKEILKQQGILVGSHIFSIKDINDESFDEVKVDDNLLNELREKEIPVINDEKAKLMKEVILKAKGEQDSVGGIIECIIANVPTGLGEPYFNSVESKISQGMFSVPGVKGIEFGEGFNITKLMGSEANDSFYIDENNQIKTKTNNNGGVLGGLTTGMPITFKVAMKPTPSIGKPQETVNIKTMKDTILEIKGRHDPCIVQRAVPVIESIGAFVILDLMLGANKI